MIAVKLTVNNDKDFYSYWLNIFKFVHKLSNRESESLLQFILKRKELEKSITEDSLIREILFSAKTKQEICDILEYSSARSFNNNVIKALKEKKAFIKIGDQWDINKTLMPNSNEKSLTFKFIRKND